MISPAAHLSDEELLREIVNRGRFRDLIFELVKQAQKEHEPAQKKKTTLLTIPEAAKALSVSVASLRGRKRQSVWKAAGIKFVRIGRLVRIPASSIEFVLGHAIKYDEPVFEYPVETPTISPGQFPPQTVPRYRGRAL